MKADVRHYLTFAAMLVALGSCRPQRIDVKESAVRPISMMELHRAGGVPVGWRFTVPPGDAAAGRRAFIDFGCQSCHPVEGEHFPSAAGGESGAGPDLAGMGSHHPAAYFAESILDPNAVLVDGPGYLGRDGRSIMPTYGDMTMRQLCDLVAYLKSLKSGGTDHVHSIASTYYVEVDRVTADQIEAFDDWFAQDGVQELNAINGFVSLDTYVDRSPGDRTLVRVYGFDSEAGLGEFLKWRASPTATSALGDAAATDGPAPLRSPALYKAVGLSLP